MSLSDHHVLQVNKNFSNKNKDHCLAVITAGIMAKFYNFPIFIWGPLMPSTITDGGRFPTLSTTAVISSRYNKVTIGVVDKWVTFVG